VDRLDGLHRGECYPIAAIPWWWVGWHGFFFTGGEHDQPWTVVEEEEQDSDSSLQLRPPAAPQSGMVSLLDRTWSFEDRTLFAVLARDASSNCSVERSSIRVAVDPPLARSSASVSFPSIDNSWLRFVFCLLPGRLDTPRDEPPRLLCT
jgi:hypothetical protein